MASERADRIILRLKEKNRERKEEKERKNALKPQIPEGPINANPPVFKSKDSLSVLFNNSFGFSQGVALGNILKVAGQGGWDADGVLHVDVSDQIGQACDNVAANLALLRSYAGWDYVYQIKTYHTNFSESLELTLAHLQARMQRHRPIWTCVEVTNLKLPGMVIEIEVEAYLEKQDGAL